MRSVSVLKRKREIQDSVAGKHVLYMLGFIEGVKEVGRVWGMRTIVCVFICALSLNAVYNFSLSGIDMYLQHV